MGKDGKQTDCALLGHGELGWEVQLLCDGTGLTGGGGCCERKRLRKRTNCVESLIANDWTLVA
jgi:hypothetical protein